MAKPPAQGVTVFERPKAHPPGGRVEVCLVGECGHPQQELGQGIRDSGVHPFEVRVYSRDNRLVRVVHLRVRFHYVAPRDCMQHGVWNGGAISVDGTGGVTIKS